MGARLTTRLFLTLLIAIGSSGLWGQSSNSEAWNWFKKGLAEQSNQKKIAAYSKAVKLAPNFPEALYNLGMSYKKQNDYIKAERFLSQAGAIKDAQIKPELKLQILYELGITYKKLNNLQKSTKVLSEAKTLAKSGPIRPIIAFELGRVLFLQNRFFDALAELRAGRGLPSSNRDNFDQLIAQIEQQTEVDNLYNQAVVNMSIKDFNSAVVLFEQIKQKKPGYKDVDKLMTQASSEMEEVSLDKLYQQARAFETSGDRAPALATYQSILKQSSSYKDVTSRIEGLQIKLRNEEAASQYRKGQLAMQSKKWSRAIAAYEKALKISPGYPGAQKRLSESKKALKQKKKSTVAASYYRKGEAALNNGNFKRALADFKNAYSADQRYRDSKRRIADLERRLKDSAELPQVAGVNSDSLYAQALADAQAADFESALLKLQKIQAAQPDFRDVSALLISLSDSLTISNQKLIAKINQNKKNNTASFSDGQVKYIGGVVAAGMGLFLMFFIALSPTAHVKYHIFFQNLDKAIKIYEKLLSKRPERLKLYPKLAELYLLKGKTSERAIKVFEMTVRLKLFTPKFDEISAALSKHALTPKETKDLDAIKILEEELNRTARY